MRNKLPRTGYALHKGTASKGVKFTSGVLGNIISNKKEGMPFSKVHKG